MTPQEAITKLKGLPEDQQREVLSRLSPDERKGILSNLSGQSAATGFIGPRTQNLQNWLQDLRGDVRYGTGTTFPGRVLRGMGATGTTRGVPESVATMMPGGGTIEGASHIAGGVDQIAHGHPIKGSDEAVQGFGQAAAPAIAATSPEFLPAAVGYGAAGAAATRTAEAFGASPETADFIGNFLIGALGSKAALGKSTDKTTAKLAFGSGKGSTIPIEATRSDLLKTVSGSGAPETVRDFLATVNTTKSNLNQEFTNALGPHANQQIVPVDVSRRILDLITPNMQQTAEGRAEAQYIRKAATEFQKPWTLAQLNSERMGRFADLGSYHNKLPVGKYMAERGNVNVAIDKAVNDAIKDTIYPMMDRFTGKPAGFFADLQGRVSNLISLQNSLDKQVNELHDVAMRQKGAPLFSRGRIRANIGESGTPRFWMSNVLSALHAPNDEATANKAIRSAFASGASPESFIMALPVKVLLSGEVPNLSRTQQLQQTREQQSSSQQ